MCILSTGTGVLTSQRHVCSGVQLLPQRGVRCTSEGLACVWAAAALSLLALRLHLRKGNPSRPVTDSLAANSERSVGSWLLQLTCTSVL